MYSKPLILSIFVIPCTIFLNHDERYITVIRSLTVFFVPLIYLFYISFGCLFCVWLKCLCIIYYVKYVFILGKIFYHAHTYRYVWCLIYLILLYGQGYFTGNKNTRRIHVSLQQFRKLSLPPFMVDATITQLYLCHMLSFRNLIL